MDKYDRLHYKEDSLAAKDKLAGNTSTHWKLWNNSKQQQSFKLPVVTLQYWRYCIAVRCNTSLVREPMADCGSCGRHSLWAKQHIEMLPSTQHSPGHWPGSIQYLSVSVLCFTPWNSSITCRVFTVTSQF